MDQVPLFGLVIRPIGSSDAHIRAIVLTGICGGLTTFSSALAVPVILQREHQWGYAATLITTTPLLCSGLFALGISLAVRAGSRRAWQLSWNKLSP